ncbi:Cell surface mannoprotein mp65 [Taxawa tesnikishii (nom. ined.)]|nr:Cell surface mannoprotein mp65 [Dothideales sp. JES 119]
MKTGFAVAALAGLAVAQPNPHRRGHRHLHEKRDVVTEVDYVTATAPSVVVYVDESGNPLYTSYADAATSVATQAAVVASSPSAYSAPAASSAKATSAAAPVSSSAPVAYSASAYSSPAASSAAASSAAPASSSAAASSSSSSAGSVPSGYGITYSPYNADGTCKTQDQVSSDFEKISGYDMVRLYGTDCNQVSTIYTAATAKGMKLFAGVYDITQTSSSIQQIIDVANGDWSAFHTIAIGNEGVNNGQYTVEAVTSAIGTARSLLKAAGYTGPVVTVDTFVAMIANPALCQASDYAAANAHAFFDGGVTAQDAGPWLLEQMQRVSSACGGMNTWITETGWPTQGNSNNKAVPSKENQDAAISSIKENVSSNVILFTAFNDLWKSDNAGTYGCEKYWGMLS